MRIVVAGNLGYLGSVLTPLLVQKGYDVTGFDADFFSGCDFTPQNFQGKQIKKDIRDAEIKDFEGYDALIHLANISNDPMGELNPDLTYDINHKATVRLAEISKQAGIKRFIFSSTQSVYGNSHGEIVTEEAIVKPLTAYAKSKYLSEGEISAMSSDSFTPVFMRPTTICGASPRLRCDLLINAMTAHAVTTQKVYVYSDHDVWRASLHIEDVSKAFIAALEAESNLVRNQVFNVGGNEDNHTTKNIAQMVKESVEGCELVFTHQLGKDTRSYKSDYRKILKTLQYQPQWDTKACISQLVEVFSKNKLTESMLETSLHRLKVLKQKIDKGVLDTDLRYNRV